MSKVKVKGTSLIDLVLCIKDALPDKYEAWFEALPIDSKKIFGEQLLNINFYDLTYGRIEPMRVLSKVCFNGEIEKAAYDCGIYGGKKSLKTIYSIFIKIPTIDFVVKRAARIISTYFENVSIDVVANDSDFIAVALKGFNKDEFSMVINIAGWIDYLLQIISKKEFKVTYFPILTSDNQMIGRIDTYFGEKIKEIKKVDLSEYLSQL